MGGFQAGRFFDRGGFFKEIGSFKGFGGFFFLKEKVLNVFSSSFFFLTKWVLQWFF